MDATDDISSTWENEKRSNDHGVCSENLRYDCDSETEYDSENETIDVICENSKLSVARLCAQNQRGPTSICANERVCYDHRGTTGSSSKTLNLNTSFCDNSETTNSAKNNNISKSKTFLIDNILGNNKSDSSQINLCNDDSDNFEETTDEHNGK